MVQNTYSRLKLLILVVSALALAGCGAPTTTSTTVGGDHSHASEAADHAHSKGSGESRQHSHGEEFELPHIHGLGFSADGEHLYIPAHIGLYTVSDGRWSRPTGPQHDYMGFAISDDGFYSSGHPAPSATDLPNPLGLVKSTDGGATLNMLGFAGESDFHLMAVGYNNHAIYVVNPAQNSKLAPGLHFSLDNGKTWKQSTLQGVSAAPYAIAAHPTEAQMVALGTEQGVLLSGDRGDTFTRIGQSMPVSAVAFSPNGDLLFGASDLIRYELSSKQMNALTGLALVEGEYITAIAANPANPRVIAVATSQRNMYQRHDTGEQWDTLASNGVGINPHDE